MDKKQVYIIAGVIVMVILLIIGIFFEIRDVPNYSWITKYDLEEKDPIDAYVFTQLIEKRFGEDAIEFKGDSTTIDSLSKRQLYLSIGSSIRYNTGDQENLLKFIEAGNDAVLISSQVNFTIPAKFSIEDADQYEEDNFSIDGLEDIFNEDGDDEIDDGDDYSYEDYNESEDYDESIEEESNTEYVNEEVEQEAYDNDEYEEDSNDDNEQEGNVTYEDSIVKNVNISRFITFHLRDTIIEFDFMPFDSAEANYSYTHYGREFDSAEKNSFNHFTSYQSLVREPIIYTKDNQHIYCKIKVGEGNLYIHTVPELFTNLATQQSFYLDHFNKVFSPFDVDRVIIDKPDPLSYLFDKKDKKSPLQYILSVPSLSWAYYLLVGTLILFVIFRGKRTQRIIPTVQKNTNTSMDYIKTLSVLHQNQGQNSKLIKHIREGFFHRIKTKYFLDHKDEFFLEKLAAKSKIELKEIENLLHKLHSTGGAEFSDDQLITLYKQIESFYKKAA